MTDASNADKFPPGLSGTGDCALAEPLRDALLESRERWRDLASMAADFAFETDIDGRFVFLAPATVIGWQADALLGGSSDQLLADCGDAAGISPFRSDSPLRNRHAWLRRPDGTPCWARISATPLLGADGQVKGVRGVGRDASSAEGSEAAMARERRRTELADQIVWYMRTEILAPRMMRKALGALVRTLGAAGAMLLESAADSAHTPSADQDQDALLHELLHSVGGDLPSVRRCAIEHLRQGGAPAMLADAEHHGCLICALPSRFNGAPGLVVWREPDQPAWDADDLTLLTGAIGTMRVLLELGAIQQETALQARTDSLTGLFNRRAFSEEVTRRLDRLERDKLPGTLVLANIDNFRTLNDQRGAAIGDEALKIVTILLREASRPGDIVARLGGDSFAVWYDGMDHLSAAERAESLRLKGPLALSPLSERPIGLSLSLGIATRWPGFALETEELLYRAEEALQDAKCAGKAQWRVWLNETGNAF